MIYLNAFSISALRMWYIYNHRWNARSFSEKVWLGIIFSTNQPVEYCMKISSLVAVKTYYTHNMEIFAVRQPERQSKLLNDAFSVVKRHVFHIIIDIYFTSVTLVIEGYINQDVISKPHCPLSTTNMCCEGSSRNHQDYDT